MKLEILFNSGATKVFDSAYSTLEEMQIDLKKVVLQPNEVHVMRFIDGWVWTREIAAIRIVSHRYQLDKHARGGPHLLEHQGGVA